MDAITPLVPEESVPFVGEALRRLRAVGKPQLRRPHPPRRQDELPGLAATGRCLRDRRHHGPRPHHRAARVRP